ncbi:MAG: hypothetical protein JKY61_10070 [Planctomycetes bacterium]|nr:hypothetical protein [Planctomycetota bacterium]
MTWGATFILTMGIGVASPVVSLESPGPTETQAQRKPCKAVEPAFKRLEAKPSPLSLQAALESLARQFPERVALDTYGKSRLGRSLYRLRVLPWDTELNRAKHGQPAVAIVAGLEEPLDPVETLRLIAGFARADKPLTDLELIFFPMPDPDGWVAGGGGSADEARVRLEHNFPVGWSPWQAGRGHPGSVPLSEPETRALSQSLVLSREIMALVLMGKHGAAGRQTSAGGSLQRYAKEGLGLLVTFMSEAEGNGLGDALQRVQVRRPRLQVHNITSQRLSQELWMVEFELAHMGQASGLGAHSQVKLKVSGARRLKLAWAPQRKASFEQLGGDFIPRLPAPGRPIGVRMILKIQDPGAVTLHLDAPRLNSMSVKMLGGTEFVDAR